MGATSDHNETPPPEDHVSMTRIEVLENLINYYKKHNQNGEHTERITKYEQELVQIINFEQIQRINRVIGAQTQLFISYGASWASSSKYAQELLGITVGYADGLKSVVQSILKKVGENDPEHDPTATSSNEPPQKKTWTDAERRNRVGG